MPSNKSRVVIACAGSRKTSSIVEEALLCKDSKVLITTYTNENVDQLNAYLIERNGFVPPNITVLSWYSFLLQEGVRPYQNRLVSTDRVKTIDFASDAKKYVAKADPTRYYLNSSGDIYRDRVADFIVECEKKSGGLVIKRLEKIYSHIFIDELQDLSGYDLELLEKLFQSSIAIIAVGDPRQATFTTNNAAKNKQFKKSHILNWILEKKKAGLFPVEERTHCYRSNQAICDFADALFPELSVSVSQNNAATGHDGIHQIGSEAVEAYFKLHRPIVLRYSKKTDTLGLEAFNIGAMKGRTFDRVLIFPTTPMKKYLKSKIVADAGDVSKLYVAVTRARFSVAFVV